MKIKIFCHFRSKTGNPNSEADPPQTELVEEVTNILDTLQSLNNHLRKAETAHKKLTANKCKLEHNIAVKVNSINIDANLIMNREVNFHTVIEIQVLQFTGNNIHGCPLGLQGYKIGVTQSFN